MSKKNRFLALPAWNDQDLAVDGSCEENSGGLSLSHSDGLLCHSMEIDHEKVDEITLASLYLTTFKDKHGLRARKSHDWDVLNRLHERGYIHDPATKATSVMLTEEGAALRFTIVGVALFFSGVALVASQLGWF